MSTHIIPIFRVTEVQAHPNADRLELIPVKGWVCAVKKGDFKVGDLAVYIEPDYMVPVTRPEFAFLKDPAKFDQTHSRIRGKRLRGVMSFGLIIPAPTVPLVDMDTNETRLPREGDNLLHALGIHRWEPPMVGKGNGQGFSVPDTFHPRIPMGATKFDLENIKNYPHLIAEGEDVVMTEKIHGANGRFVYYTGHEEVPEGMMVGSRSRWLRRPNDAEKEQGHKTDIWWMAHDKYPDIARFCKDHPNMILYGEVYGNVQDLKYGLPNDIAFAAFALYDPHRGVWCGHDEMMSALHEYFVPMAPVLSRGPFSKEAMEFMAEQNSSIAPNQMREGVVVTPLTERVDPRYGRISLKYISNRYWERKL